MDENVSTLLKEVVKSEENVFIPSKQLQFSEEILSLVALLKDLLSVGDKPKIPVLLILPLLASPKWWLHLKKKNLIFK